MIRPLLPLVTAMLMLGAEEPLVLRNEALEVTVDPGAGRVVLRQAGAKAAFASGILRGKVNKTEREAEGLRLRYNEGGSDLLTLPTGSPFARIQPTFAAGDKATVFNRLDVLRLDLDLGADEVTTFGTGGLVKPGDKPASYAWLAVAHPGTRDGVVAGWLTHERATGVVACEGASGSLHLTGRAEYGRLALAANGEVTGEVFVIGAFADARLGLEAWSDAVASGMKISLPPMPVVYCTWYSQRHGGAGDAASTAELAAFAAKELKPYGFTCVQIDDGWQLGDNKGNGPRKVFSGHNPKGPYAAGMGPTAQAIAAQGLTPGIWLLPFGGTAGDPFFASHQDWFVRNPAGQPFDTPWGGTCLDMTHPGAREFLRSEIAQITGPWGYRYLKIDGLSTGLGVQPQYVNAGWREDNFGDGTFYDPAVTNTDAFRSGLRLLRETAGKDSFVLGCCSAQNMRSYAASFGLVDAMRTGPDNGGSWKGWLSSSPLFGSRHHHLNGRIWYNDPDPIYVRESLSLDEARTIASWNALAGHMTSLSEWLPDLPAERLDILRRVMPGHGVKAQQLDLFEVQPTRQWLVTDDRPGHARRDVLGLFNWDDKPRTETIEISRLGLPAAPGWSVYDFWNDRPLEPISDRLTVEIPAHGSRILALHPRLDRPYLLSTSRHVSQGILEVTGETWEPQTRTLAGRSEVVAGDAYELRVAAPGHTLAGVELSAADVAAGVTVSSTAANGFVRVKIRTTQSRAVAWTTRFTAGAMAPGIIDPVAGLVSVLSADGDTFVWRWTGVDGVDVELAVDGGQPRRSATGFLGFQGLEGGTSHKFTATAVAWDGRRSSPVTVEATIPQAKPRPGVPPIPTTSLLTLTATKATTARGQVMPKMNADGASMTLGGTVYADGLGVVAPSTLVYPVPAKARRFVAIAGLDDKVKTPGVAVVLKVLGEPAKGKPRELAASPVIRSDHQARTWNFDLTVPKGIERFHLVAVAVDGPDRAAQVDWVEAGFLE